MNVYFGLRYNGILFLKAAVYLSSGKISTSIAPNITFQTKNMYAYCQLTQFDYKSLKKGLKILYLRIHDIDENNFSNYLFKINKDDIMGLPFNCKSTLPYSSNAITVYNESWSTFTSNIYTSTNILTTLLISTQTKDRKKNTLNSTVFNKKEKTILSEKVYQTRPNTMLVVRSSSQRINNTNTNTKKSVEDLSSKWSQWYTSSCIVQKTRRNSLNEVKTIKFRIDSLELCDKLSSK